MKTFVLKRSDEFGPDGPQAGDYGYANDRDKRFIDDEVWYTCLFDGFEGFYLLPDYLMGWTE